MKAAALSLLIGLLLSGPVVHAHPDHTDPALLELNDYLMAIQVMRIYDQEAQSLFSMWQTLSEESWYIRQLTDERNLSIDAPDVMEQISHTRNLQKELLLNCRAYFASLLETQEGVTFTIEDAIAVSWSGTVLNVPVDEARVLLFKIENDTRVRRRITMKGDRNDQLLFWGKIFDLDPGDSRYTFMIVAPLEEGKATSQISITDDRGRSQQVMITGNGTSAGTRYTLEPGGTIYEVNLPGTLWQTTETWQSDERITFDIADRETGQSIPARVEVRDDTGQAFWSPLSGAAYAVDREEYGWTSPLWEFQPGPYFYVDGPVSLGVDPSYKTASVYHGFEYKPQIIDIPTNGEVRVSLERWINMPERGWYSGHTHIHTTDAGVPVQFTRHWPSVSRAEDLHFSGILTLKGEWLTHAIYANEYPVGTLDRFSTSNHIISYGQEYRNNPYGHLALLGLDNLIQPISSGALGELGGPDFPPNTTILDEAIGQGAVTIGAHFGNFIAEGQQIKTPWPSTGFEMPIDVALGKIQLAEVYGEGGQQEIWYDLLNCGFKIPATAGPDWAIKDTPRAYVFLGEEEFTADNWLRRLKEGKSFITRGPMLFFKVNGKLAGSEIALNPSEPLRIEARAMTSEGNREVELIYNGNVILKDNNIRTEIFLEDSGWLAARCEGAHSNPIYIDLAGRPAGFVAPAEKFIGITDRLIEWVNTKGLYDTPRQKELVKSELMKGRRAFSDIVDRAGQLGRIEP